MFTESDEWSSHRQSCGLDLRSFELQEMVVISSNLARRSGRWLQLLSSHVPWFPANVRQIWRFISVSECSDLFWHFAFSLLHALARDEAFSFLYHLWQHFLIVGLAQMIKMPEDWKWKCFFCAETLSISPQPHWALEDCSCFKRRCSCFLLSQERKLSGAE